jgi:uncharacterized protein (UPF0548 family)
MNRDIFLQEAEKSDYSYSDIYCTQIPFAPKHFDLDNVAVKIGEGQAFFAEAKKALVHWKMFPKWAIVDSQGKPAFLSQNVMVSFRLLGIWWHNACRVLYFIDEPTRFGFAYGTLAKHLEAGEELFLLEIDEKEQVFYRIIAVSRPRHILAKIGYFYARWMQSVFRRDSAIRMTHIQHEN